MVITNAIIVLPGESNITVGVKAQKCQEEKQVSLIASWLALLPY